jgi:hypothetical protein
MLSSGTWMPPVDIYQNGDRELVLKAELPDMSREDIDITVDNGTLTIKGEKKFPTDLGEDSFHRIERRYGPFSRSFSLPKTVDPAKVAAEYKNGCWPSGCRCADSSRGRSRSRSPRNRAMPKAGRGGRRCPHPPLSASPACMLVLECLWKLQTPSTIRMTRRLCRPGAPPIQSRFLFVDVAALRQAAAGARACASRPAGGRRAEAGTDCDGRSAREERALDVPAERAASVGQEA